MKKSLSIVVGILVLSAVLLTACGGGDSGTAAYSVPTDYAGKTNPFAGDSAAASAGMAIYEAKCQSCHGASGKGDGPAGQALTPPASDLTQVVKSAGVDYLYYRIAEGGVMDPYNSSMPPHKDILSEDEIWQIVTYVETLK